MEEQKNNIRVLFTSKANLALEEIMKKFNLQDSDEKYIARIKENKLPKIVVIDHLAKDFVKGNILENDLISSLQKDLEVSSQTAEQISKEIINKIIPFLEKAPEKNFKDPAFVEEISKKVFNTIENNKTATEKKDLDLFPKITPLEEGISKITTPTPKKQQKTKLTSSLEKKEISVPQIKESKTPDNYREPIE